jgi:hypothetical protein
MDQFAPQPDLSLQLPRDMYYQLIHTLCASLPPPVTNSPEDRIRRDNAAIAQIACLLPANADEANIAAQYVAANDQAMDCLRLAQEHRSDEQLFLRCTAQAASMMRQARGARSLLMRVQAQREKREADAGALDRANWTEHCAIGLMADALGHNAPAPIEEPAPSPPAPMPAQAAKLHPDMIIEAEQFALIHPNLTALIRAAGGLPEPVLAALGPAIAPPSPALLHAIVTGTSPSLRALDRPAEFAAAAE